MNPNAESGDTYDFSENSYVSPLSLRTPLLGKVFALLWEAAGLSIWAVAAAILALQLTVPPWGPAAAVLGSILGVGLGRRLGRGPLRLPWIWTGGIVACLLVEGVAVAARGASFLPDLLGPRLAYQLTDDVSWLLFAAACVSVLKASSERISAFVVLEAAVVASCVASLFAAHRHGLISFPYFLVDPLWARGMNPEPVLVAIGALVSGMLVLLVAWHHSGRRSIIDVALLLLFVGGLYLWYPVPLSPNMRAKDFPPTGNGRDGSGGKGGKDELVAIVILHGDYDHPPTGYFYLRQDANSVYNGVRLVHDTTGTLDRDTASTFPVEGPITLPVEKHAFSQELETTVALLVPHARPFGMVNPSAFSPMENTDPSRFVRIYQVRSQVLISYYALRGRKAGDARWDDATRRTYTAIPVDPRYQALADRIVAEAPPNLRSTPLGRAVAIKLWLEDHGTYSLKKRGNTDIDSMDDAGPDLVAEFLFGDLTGYCVYFANAACYLYRAVGMPSRVAGGYAVNPQFRVGSTLAVLNASAHAWPEIYLDGLGWTVLDIAPKKGDAPAPVPPDPNLLRILSERVRRSSARAMQPPAGGDFQRLLREWLRAMARALAWLLAGGLVAMYGIKAWRRLAPRFAAPRHRLNLAYRATLDRLGDAGRWRGYGQTREDFARSNHALCPPFLELTGLHLRETLGRPGEPLAPDRVLELYRDAARHIHRSAAWHRRLLGWLNPISWWWVR